MASASATTPEQTYRQNQAMWDSQFRQVVVSINRVWNVPERAAFTELMKLMMFTKYLADAAFWRSLQAEATILEMRHRDHAGDPRVVRKSLYELGAGPGRPGRPAPPTMPLRPADVPHDSETPR